MHQIYEIEIAKETLASLSYIALECGFKFSNKQQFDNIMYRLYNYLKADIKFDDGIVVNAEIKNKINEFKDIYETLPTPDISTDDVFLYTAPKGTTQTDVMPTVHVIQDDLPEFIPYKFKLSELATGTIYVTAGFKKTEDDDEELTTIEVASGTIPENTAYFKVTIYMSSRTRYNAKVTYMSEDGVELGTVTRSVSSAYMPMTYIYLRVTQVYSAVAEVSIYQEKQYNFTIDCSNLININSDKIVENDKYYASDIIPIPDKKPLGKYALSGKKLNGISTDKEFEFIKDLTGEILTYDGNEMKFISVLKNQDTGSFIGTASSYPLYYTDVNGEDGLWGVSTADITPLKLYESIDGVVWDEIQTSFNSNPYKNGAIEVKTYPIWKAGYKLTYNNYPIYYSYVDYTKLLAQVNAIGFEEENLEEAIDFMEMYPIQTLANERACNGTLLQIFKQSDEDFTISMLPMGGAFFLGKHKIEDSPKFPIVWKVLDYSNNYNNYVGSSRYPANTVMAQTYHAIDNLPLIAKKNYTVANLQNENLPLFRWINSTKQVWFEQLASNDTPVDDENCGNDAYTHRFGFLYNWSKADIGVLRDMNHEGYSNLKISLPARLEGRASNISQTVKLYRAFANSIWIDRPKFVKEILFHKNPDVVSGAGEIQDEFTVSKESLNYWRRDYLGSGRYANSNTSNGALSYMSYPINPMVCVSADTIINKDSMSKGVFILETQANTDSIEVDKTYNTERTTVLTGNFIGRTKLDIRSYLLKSFETVRTLGYTGDFVAKTERQIRSIVDKTIDSVRDIRTNVLKSFKTERKANFRYLFKFNSKRDVVKNCTLDKIPTERILIQKLVIDKTFNTVRNIVINSNKLYKKLTRTLNVSDDIRFNSERNVRANVNFKKPLRRKLVYGKTYSFNSIRDIRKNENKSYKSKRSTIVKYSSPLYKTERIIRELESFIFRTSRETRVNEDKIYSNVVRDIRENVAFTGYIERLIAENKDILYSGFERDIRVLSDKKYRALREIIIKEVFESSLIRNIIQSIEFKTRLERYTAETYGNDYQAMREVVADMEKISEAMRNVVANEEVSYQDATRDVRANAQEDFGTKRIITVPEDENKFVSKKNLLVYTHLLKQEIAVYVDGRIEQAFIDRGL